MTDPEEKARIERDIWTGLFEREKRRLIDGGVAEGQADVTASALVRRLIRDRDIEEEKMDCYQYGRR